jgi:carboxypeptidase T
MKRLLPFAILLAFAAAAWANPWDNYYVRVDATTPAGRGIVANTGMDIFAVRPDGVVGLASQDQIERLIVAGFAVEYLALPEHAPGVAAGFPPSDALYHDYSEMVTLLQQWANDHPDFIQLYSIGKTIQNRELWTLKISDNVQTDESATEAGFVIVGQHHAREHISREVPLGFVQYLVDTYDVLYSTTTLVDSTEIWVTPSLNPDGAEYDIASGSYQYQRKNMRDNPGTPCDGVDLNRNYGYHWGEGGSSDYECDEIYHGPSAFSEPETQHFRDHVMSHPNITLLVTYHNYSELVLYPWGYTYDQLPQPDRTRHQQLAAVYADFTGYTDQQSVDLYPTSGDTTDWAYGALGITSFTVELSPGDFGDFYLPDEQIDDVQRANLPAMLYLLAQAGADSKTGARVTVDDIRADVAAYRSRQAVAAVRDAIAPVTPELACGVLPFDSGRGTAWGPLVLTLVLLVPTLIFFVRRRGRR